MEIICGCSRDTKQITGIWKISSISQKDKGNLTPLGRAEMQFKIDKTCLLLSDDSKGLLKSREGFWKLDKNNIITYTLSNPSNSVSWNYSFEGKKMIFSDSEIELSMRLERIQAFTLK